MHFSTDTLITLVFERLVDPGSIPALALRRCVLGKDNLSIFPIRAKLSTFVVAQPDERLANRTQKSALR